MKIIDFIGHIEQLFPLHLQEEWDNSGWQIRLPELKDNNNNNILVAVSLSEHIISEALDKDAALIITHHPFFFKAINRIDTRYYPGKLIDTLIRNNISVYATHTPCDAGKNGIADYWADVFSLSECMPIFPTEHNPEKEGIGRKGFLSEHLSLDEISNILHNNGISKIEVGGMVKNKYKELYILPGSGKSALRKVKRNALFISSDMGYHEAEHAHNYNFTIINTSHFEIEAVFKSIIQKAAEKANVNIIISDKDVDYFTT